MPYLRWYSASGSSGAKRRRHKIPIGVKTALRSIRTVTPASLGPVKRAVMHFRVVVGKVEMADLEEMVNQEVRAGKEAAATVQTSNQARVERVEMEDQAQAKVLVGREGRAVTEVLGRREGREVKEA